MTPRLLCNVVYALHIAALGPGVRGDFDAALDEPLGREAVQEQALLRDLQAG